MWVIRIAPVRSLFPQHQFSSSTSINSHYFQFINGNIELASATTPRISIEIVGHFLPNCRSRANGQLSSQRETTCEVCCMLTTRLFNSN